PPPPEPPDDPEPPPPPEPECDDPAGFVRPAGTVPPGYIYSPTNFGGGVADPQPDDTFAADAPGHATHVGRLRTAWRTAARNSWCAPTSVPTRPPMRSRRYR